MQCLHFQKIESLKLTKPNCLVTLTNEMIIISFYLNNFFCLTSNLVFDYVR